jgi:hypothetical protein
MLQNVEVPLAGTDVEITGAGRVAILAAAATGQPVIQVIVGQENLVDPREEFRKLLLGPQQFGNGVARRDGDPQTLQRARFAAQIIEQPVVLRR